MNTLELLQKEKEEFIKVMKIEPNWSLKEIDDYYFGVRKAFNDAFNQYARREKKKYAKDKNDLIKPIVERLFSYFNSDDSFDKCFEDCIEHSKKILKNDTYGLAQKFTNMSFKYLYCYADAVDFEDKFKDCHMPLDKYTIKWVKFLGNETINQRLGLINNAFSKIDESLYNDIQELITDTLNSNYHYTISFNKQASETSCILPENKIYAEFIIWHQEKINELHNTIKRAEGDFERLGISWI